jgi:hypothetical protein
MLPVIESFMAAHDLPDVTVLAEALLHWPISAHDRARLTRMTGCQMAVVSSSNAARIRWRAGTSVASS